MESRPAKRQRRSTVVLSDDDEEYEAPTTRASKISTQREITFDGRTSANVSPAKPKKTKTGSKRPAPKQSPKSSPEKVKKNTGAVGNKSATELGKSKSLHTFFSKATEEERWRKKSVTPDVVSENGELGDDIIEDDDLSDDTLQELGLRTDKAIMTLDRRKPSVTVLESLKNGRVSVSGSLPSSQRFVKKAVQKDVKIKVEAQDGAPVENFRPWADRYGPTTLEELVVHKKKVSDVHSWLQGKVQGRNTQKLLVLKGPAGSGKTTTISLLAKTMGLQLVFWQNPGMVEGGRLNSIAAQFDEFLNRGGQFGGLAFASDPDSSTTASNESHGRILIVEEFPSSSGSLQAFRSVILQYLARAKVTAPVGFPAHHATNEPPVVMIISETLLSSSTALSDSFTAHRLLGPEILNNPYVTTIEFNPVATTFVTKALDLVMKKEARDSRRRRMPGPAVIQRIAEMGDVRSAVNSLEFLCVRNGDGSEWSGTIAGTNPKKSSKGSVHLTEMEKDSLQLVSQRETTLDMFHAAGKIVYNKREDPRVQDTRAEPPPKPPDHLLHLYTTKASLVDIEALLSETGTDIQTFVSTIHENYVLSCNGDMFDRAFDGCSESLSLSDLLNPDSRPSRRATNNPNASLIQANLQAGSSDTLRQDEISFNVATRGLLFNLPYPINRASVPGGKRGDNFKMFYPQSLRLWKSIEETESLVSMLSHGVAGSAGLGAAQALSGADQGVATWRSRGIGNQTDTLNYQHQGKMASSDDDEAETSTLPHLYHSKDMLTLEILPYTQRILTAKGQDTKLVDRITKFKPSAFNPAFADANADASLEDDMLDAEGISEISAPQPTLNMPSRNRFQGLGGAGKGVAQQTTSLPPPAIETLYLEEDDIVDD